LNKSREVKNYDERRSKNIVMKKECRVTKWSKKRECK
jgi:hypothetical protein